MVSQNKINIMGMRKRSQVSNLSKLKSIVNALEDFKYLPSATRKTDVIGVACQFSVVPKLKREDFANILDMKISDLIKEIELEHEEKIKKSK